MQTFLVYDRNSGKIVHIHTAAGPTAHKAEDVLPLVHPSHDRSQLEVVEVEPAQIRPGNAYRVNPQTKKLEAAKKEGTSSAAGARQRVAPRSSNR
jgi:hypothetical protein